LSTNVGGEFKNRNDSGNLAYSPKTSPLRTNSQAADSKKKDTRPVSRFMKAF